MVQAFFAQLLSSCRNTGSSAGGMSGVPATSGPVLLVLLILVAAIWLAGGLVFWTLEADHSGWTVTNSLYFCFVTLSGVGFSNVMPQSLAARVFSQVYVVVGLGAVASLLSSLADWLYEVLASISGSDGSSSSSSSSHGRHILAAFAVSLLLFSALHAAYPARSDHLRTAEVSEHPAVMPTQARRLAQRAATGQGSGGAPIRSLDSFCWKKQTNKLIPSPKEQPQDLEPLLTDELGPEVLPEWCEEQKNCSSCTEHLACGWQGDGLGCFAGCQVQDMWCVRKGDTCPVPQAECQIHNGDCAGCASIGCQYMDGNCQSVCPMFLTAAGLENHPPCSITTKQCEADYPKLAPGNESAGSYGSGDSVPKG